MKSQLMSQSMPTILSPPEDSLLPVPEIFDNLLTHNLRVRRLHSKPCLSRYCLPLTVKDSEAAAIGFDTLKP